jgi:class 3 adenylate cyclase/tetratricopeptide (TPR) repeat protein
VTAQSIVCPSCGTALPAGAKFCPSCGTPIAPRSDERRIVTVLFADVVGFTPLSEARDPEHVKNLLDRCFERLAADVTSHGGRVDKIVGDEIMAVFGAPIAHEDDPERAVRAALLMQRTLIEHAAETGGAEVRMRIGINTGEVLVGALRGGGDVTALGDVVNTAKRLQTSAEPGQVLVGPATHASTREVIGYDDAGALEVKGREALVDAWVAVEALGPPGFRPGRIRTPLFGRKAELGMLWHALGTAVDHRHPQLVLLIGDAGVGKTRLVEEAVEMAQVQHGALVIEGRCLPYGEANPWWPIAEALRQVCGIDPDDDADVAATKCREAVAGVLDTQDEGVEAGRVADALLYLMGYEESLEDVEPSRAREEAVRAIQVSLAANARQRPLVIVLSEIHWADELVLDLIDVMFERLWDLPIMLLATARPELQDRWQPKPGRHNLYVINLHPLEKTAASDLVRTLLGTEPSPELVDVVVERGGGNPLFLEELVALFGETGMAPTGSHTELSELPATLRGLVAARLDALDRSERSVLQDAAVIGRSGPVDALTALGSARGVHESSGELNALAHKDLIVLDDDEFEFKSEIVRDVAYETLTKGDRARRHASVAQWMADHAKRTEREDEHIERIAHHFAQAAQLSREVGAVDGVPSTIFDEAIGWLERATKRAEQRETVAVSVHLLEHALELVSDDQPERKAKFLLSRARGRAGLRDMDGAHADIDEVLQIAARTDSAALRARALTIRGEIEQKENALEASASTLEQAVDEWRRVGDRHGEAEALRLWGFTSIHRGELDAAESAIDEALGISRALKDRRGEAWALQNLAWASFARGDYDKAENRLRAALNLFQDIGDFGGMGWAFGLLGYVWYFKGRLEEALTVAENGLERTREMGDRWAHGMILNLFAGIRLWQGHTREALDRATEAHRLFEEISDEMGLILSAFSKATALLMLGRSDEAIELADRFIMRAGSVFGGGPAGPMSAATMRAISGDPEAALDVLDEHTKGSDDENVLITRGVVLFVAGRGAEAYEAASAAWATDPTEPGERANFAAVLSLAAAAAGRGLEAVQAGDEVGRVGGTYLDQIRAHLGRALGYAQLGAAVEARSAISSATLIARGTEDEVNRALVDLAHGVVEDALGEDGGPVITEASDRLVELNVKPESWERAMRAAAGTPQEVGRG